MHLLAFSRFRDLLALKRVAVVAAVAVVSLGVATAPAAADYYDGGMSSAVLDIQPYSYNDMWQGPMDQALANWNATDTPASFSKSDDSDNTVVSSSFDDTWYGLYTKSWSFGYYFEIQLNARTISEDATNFGNFVTSTMVHELGHALSLADNPATADPSIMKHSRDRNTMTTPQRFDINDVNSFYTERP